MVRTGPGLSLAAALLLALAPAAAARQSDSAEVDPDPVGHLLEHKDSLRLAPEVVEQLVQINLDLFRRTRRIQRGIDSVVPPPSDVLGSPRPRPLTPEQRERLASLLAVRRAELIRARDAAYALLTPEQQAAARRLAERRPPRERRRPPTQP